MIPKRPYVHRFLPTGLAWGVALGLAFGATAFLERRNLIHELSTQSAILHRLASQRADQHDAHLTSLVAVFVAGGVQRTDLFLDVAATIIRFYPRIASVHVVPFDPEQQGISTAPMSAEDAELARWLGQQSSGEILIRQIPAQPNHYMLVKRAPNTDAAEHSLALVISATALIATDDPLWQRASATRRLLTPQGGVLTGGSILGGVGPILEKIEGGAGVIARLRTVIEPLVDLWPLLAIAGGIAVFWYATRARAQVVEDYQSGKLAR